VMTYRMTNIMGFQSLPFTRNLVIKGRLTWTTPTSISFGTHKLEKLERIYPVEIIEGSPLEVIDSRGNGSSWTVTAKLKEEFKNKSSKIAKNILFYKNLKGEEAITNSSAVLIAKNTIVDNQYKTTISNQWNQDNGLYLKPSPGNVQKGDYTGTIEWTLNDAP
ncbi:WxL domain-containing protein, partial [Enterococcus faecalis]